MGKRKYPPLKHSDIVAIMRALGFRAKNQVGSHVQYERPADARMPRKAVPIDDYAEFDERLLRRIVIETGFSREEFYAGDRKDSQEDPVIRLDLIIDDKAPL